MATTELYDKQGTLETLERMRREYNLSDDIMKDEEKCKEILEHGPYATVGDGEKAIGAALGAVGSYGIMKEQPFGSKSMKEIYKEQGKKLKKATWERRFAKVKRFLLGVNPTKKINP